MNKQAKFEMFLDSQERKEQANFKRDLQNEILPVLVQYIKEFSAIIKHPNWEGKTLPKLREEYKVVQSYIADNGTGRFRAEEALSSMIFWLNGWNRSTGKKFELRRESDPHYYSKASLVKRFYLEVIEIEKK